MSRTPLALAEANALIQLLVGLPVSLPWKGYGSAIFLELGALAPLRDSQQHRHGEACIWLEWDWRVEAGGSVLFGSSNSRPDIKHGIEGLSGVVVEALSIHGQVPEVLIQFSNGQRLVSAAMVTGDPEWSIRLPMARWLSCESGIVYVGDGSGTGSTIEEDAAFEFADRTAERWGVPVAQPSIGHCGSCKWYVRIDGEGSRRIRTASRHWTATTLNQTATCS